MKGEFGGSRGSLPPRAKSVPAQRSLPLDSGAWSMELGKGVYLLAVLGSGQQLAQMSLLLGPPS